MSNCKTKNNCINKYSNNNCSFNIRKWTRLNDDNCFLDTKTSQSLGPGDYNLSNYHSCNCKAPNVSKTANSQPDLHFKDGYGWVGMNGCIVDSDSMARNGSMLTNLRCKNQLFEPPYLTTPYMGRGTGDSCIEDSILEGEDTSQKRQCNTLSEVTINNFFQPLVPSVKASQNPEHLVPEVVDENWIRGGAPSRQIVRNIDYRYKCGKFYTCQ